VTIDQRNYTFLILKDDKERIQELETKINDLSQKILYSLLEDEEWAPFKNVINAETLSPERKSELEAQAIKAVKNKSVASFSLYLQKWPTSIDTRLKIYEAFLRNITKTPADEVITLNQLHVKSLKVFPLTHEILIKNMQVMLDMMRNAKSRNPDFIKKKIEAYENLLELLENSRIDVNISFSSLKKPQKFSASSEKDRDWLETQFNHENGPAFNAIQGFYDYEPPFGASSFTTADFANAYLGGGAFVHGAVQEEILCMESTLCLLLASFPSPFRELWCALSTRNPTTPNFEKRGEPGLGSPDPLFIEGLTRFRHFTGYAGKIFKEEIKDLAQPQTIKIMAAAAPNLKDSGKDPLSIEVLTEIAMTIAAEFSLHVEITEKGDAPLPFSSGPLGCGVFGNNQEAVYLLHRLMATHFNVPLQLYGFKREVRQAGRDHWRELAPKFAGKTIGECIETIRRFLVEKKPSP